MQIIPVLDLLNGIVVRGVAGKRESYRPVESCLSTSANAIDIAIAFRDQLELNQLYVADLDAILHQQPNFNILTQLVNENFELIIDAGLSEIALAKNLLQAGAIQIIAGLETIPSPQFLKLLCDTFGTERVIFSLDLVAGVPMGETSHWKKADPFSIGCEAVAMGISEMIVLDLAQVGVGEGIETLPLCEKLQERFPKLKVITGGGVKSVNDLQAIASTGVSGVLVASAFHNGVIGRNELIHNKKQFSRVGNAPRFHHH